MSTLTGHYVSSPVTRRPPRWSRPRSLVVQVCCAALLASSGCTTMRTVDPSAAAGGNQLERGDTVIVALRDGREVELIFNDWTSAGLTGTDETGILQKFENDDITGVEVERYSLLGSLGVVVVVLGVAAAAAYDSSDVY